jgi:hypothetical protein
MSNSFVLAIQRAFSRAARNFVSGLDERTKLELRLSLSKATLSLVDATDVAFRAQAERLVRDFKAESDKARTLVSLTVAVTEAELGLLEHPSAGGRKLATVTEMVDRAGGIMTPDAYRQYISQMAGYAAIALTTGDNDTDANWLEDSLHAKAITVMADHPENQLTFFAALQIACEEGAFDSELDDEDFSLPGFKSAKLDEL